MVEKTIYKCDICKKEFTMDAQNYEIGHLTVDYTLRSPNTDNYYQEATNQLDLCPDCTRKLRHFLANKL